MKRGAAVAIMITLIRGLMVLLLTLALVDCRNLERQPPPPASVAPPEESQPVPVEAAPPPTPTPAPAPPELSTSPPTPSPPPPPSGQGRGAVTPPRPPTAGEGPPETSRPPAPAAVSPSTLPAFPWPPPRYSAFSRITREWVAPDAGATLGSAARRLETAFDAAGYGERSYYRVPGGFALVSRIEQIRPDATPVDPPARWAVESPTVRAGFIDHIRALFNAPPGFYRVIVFMVTDQDFAASDRTPTSSEARGWISSGSLRLPESVGALSYTDRHDTTALIYEFERPGDQSEARLRVPSDMPGQVHLEKAGIWRALLSR